jgi:hypothetical protein
LPKQTPKIETEGFSHKALQCGSCVSRVSSRELLSYTHSVFSTLHRPIMPSVQVEFNTEYQNAHRFPAWMALSVFSIVCLAAIGAESTRDERDAAIKWSLAVASMSMIVSFLAVVAYLVARGVFVGQTPETALVVFVLAFWGAGLPVIMNPSNGIAVRDDTVTNANLYFFSWLSLAATLFLGASLAQERTGMNVHEMATASPKTTRWFGLAASSLVVMGAAVRIFREVCEDALPVVQEGAFCKRSKLAISVGVVSFVLSSAVAYLSSQRSNAVMPILAETGLTTLLLIMWCFAVGYVTFGLTSPGSKIGNLYFATWISFILAVFLFGQAFRDYVSGRMNANSASDGPTAEDHQMHESTPEIPDDDQI